jgi:hypothetical protein
MKRKHDQATPIVRVAQSLGGIPVKKAIINAHISGD